MNASTKELIQKAQAILDEGMKAEPDRDLADAWNALQVILERK